LKTTNAASGVLGHQLSENGSSPPKKKKLYLSPMFFVKKFICLCVNSKFLCTFAKKRLSMGNERITEEIEMLPQKRKNKKTFKILGI
jgi:hypothetical protein